MDGSNNELDLIKGSGLFDANWYLAHYPDAMASGLDPLEHYLKIGLRLQRDPGPKFATRLYLESHPDLLNSGINPLRHYLAHGKEGLAQGQAKSDIAEDIALVAASSLFDRKWYLWKYQDVASKGVEPVSHYVRHGAREGRDPGPAFSTVGYRTRYPEVSAPDINPLVYYLRHGQRDGRHPIPVNAIKPWWSELIPELKIHSRDNLTRDISAALARMAIPRPCPVIIVPVYNAPDEVDDCLQALLANTNGKCRVIIINDASPDIRICDLLDRYQGIDHLEIYHNDVNLGFTQTVNRGIELAGRADVVFLNSDTKVTPGWLRNLRLAVYSEEKIGTATPFSNNAGAFSAPEIGKQNPIPPWLTLDNYARAITQVSLRLYPKVPTGNGFCLYVRRDCLDEVGSLDVEAFPRGYGEENDFCMRAGRLGWSHVVDDTTLIFHVRSASFGEAKTALMKDGRAVIDARYPEYTGAVRTFFTSAQLIAARERVQVAARAISAEQRGVKPRVLFVISTITGGTPQTNQDLMGALDDRVEAFVLRCNASVITLRHYQNGIYSDLEKHILREPIKAFPHRSDEYDAIVASWLVRYAIELVHIRHIAWHGLGLVDVSKLLGLPVLFSFHDFYTICPTVNLLDDLNRYCEGSCTPSSGQCLHALWAEDDFPPLKNAAIHEWRLQLEGMLKKCDLFITTDDTAKSILIHNYPFLADRSFSVIPHGRDFQRFEQIPPALVDGEIIRILVPGNIGRTKGERELIELARVAAEHRLEIHVLGNISNDLAATSGIHWHGAYARSEFADKVRAIKPHIGGIFSIWPETFCHTLTELWASGVPVIGFDLGAVGHRIRTCRGGWLTTEPDLQGILQVVDHLRAHTDEHIEKLASVKMWQDHTARIHDCLYMGHAYFDLYRSLLGVAPGPGQPLRRPQVAVLAAGTTVNNYQVVAAPVSSHIRLLEKIQDSHLRTVRYDVVSPEASPALLVERYDAIIVQQSALNKTVALELISQAETNNCPIIFAWDDDLSERSMLPGEQGGSGGHGEATKFLLDAAKLVVVSTEILKSRLVSQTNRVVVSPDTISERLWLAPLPAVDAESPLPTDCQRRSGAETRIVCMGNKARRDELLLLKEAVLQVRELVPDLRLFIIGVTDVGEDWYEPISVPAARMDYRSFVPWVRGILATMNFAVVPLFVARGNDEKSALDYLEYSAAKLPVICSNVQTYQDVVRQGVSGLLADNDAASWAMQLLYAIKICSNMAGLGERAQEEVIAKHLLQNQEAHFDEVVLETIRRV